MSSQTLSGSQWGAIKDGISNDLEELIDIASSIHQKKGSKSRNPFSSELISNSQQLTSKMKGMFTKKDVIDMLLEAKLYDLVKHIFPEESASISPIKDNDSPVKTSDQLEAEIRAEIEKEISAYKQKIAELEEEVARLKGSGPLSDNELTDAPSPPLTWNEISMLKGALAPNYDRVAWVAEESFHGKEPNPYASRSLVTDASTLVDQMCKDFERGEIHDILRKAGLTMIATVHVPL